MSVEQRDRPICIAEIHQLAARIRAAPPLGKPVFHLAPTQPATRTKGRYIEAHRTHASLAFWNMPATLRLSFGRRCDAQHNYAFCPSELMLLNMARYQSRLDMPRYPGDADRIVDRRHSSRRPRVVGLSTLRRSTSEEV